ncbi:hypothetical protein [Dactylosporangium cerinum]
MTGRMLVTGSTGSLGRRVYERARAAGWTATGTCFTTPPPPTCASTSGTGPRSTPPCVTCDPTS